MSMNGIFVIMIPMMMIIDSHNYDEDKGIMCRTSSRNHISKSVYNSNVINLKQ